LVSIVTLQWLHVSSSISIRWNVLTTGLPPFITYQTGLQAAMTVYPAHCYTHH
jgi:hypothetical protein